MGVVQEVLAFTQYLNTVDDTVVGKGTPSSGNGLYGLLGKRFTLNHKEAKAVSDTVNVGTLYEGTYMIVKTKAGSTAAPARGKLVFVDVSTLTTDGLSAYIVTPDVTAANMGLFAGVYVNAPTKGRYCVICIAGLVIVQCSAAVGGTTAGDVAFVDGAPANTVVAVADATATSTDTTGEVKRIIGRFAEAPANSGLKLCYLYNNSVYAQI